MIKANLSHKQNFIPVEITNLKYDTIILHSRDSLLRMDRDKEDWIEYLLEDMIADFALFKYTV